MPKRIQRRRAKGWKMPADAVYVGRPTKWGNPYVVGQHGTADECVEKYEQLITVCLAGSAGKAMRDALNNLRGKNLACWCHLDKPCHADILLKIANR